MTHPLYSASVPVYKKMLSAFDEILTKTEKHVTDRKIEPDALLQARLFPDMFPFLRQVQIACDFAKSVPARLAGVDVPAYEDNERTFADLHARIAKTLAFASGIDAAKFAGTRRPRDRAASRHAARTQIRRRRSVSPQLRHPAVLLPSDDGVRAAAP